MITKKSKVATDCEHLIQAYLAAAVSFGDTQRNRDFEAGNQFATDLGRLGKALREAESGKRLLLQVLTHEDPYVRIWAAGDCLSFAPNVAVPVLEEIEATKGLLGTTARMTLSEWKAGRLFKNS